MSRLKPKVKQFGFNQKELKEAAAKIASILTLEDDASEEEVNAAIDEAIDAKLDDYRFAQSYANRLRNEMAKDDIENEKDDDEDDEDNDDSSSRQTRRKPGRPPKKDDEEPAYFKKLRESIEARFAAIEGQRTADSRKSKLEAILQKSSSESYKKRSLSDFKYMKFENDEEFEEWLAGEEEGVKEHNQELADKGLGGTPPGAGNGGKGGAEPELTDAEADAIVATY